MRCCFRDCQITRERVRSDPSVLCPASWNNPFSSGNASGRSPKLNILDTRGTKKLGTEAREPGGRLDRGRVFFVSFWWSGCYSVAESCVTPYDPVDCGTAGSSLLRCLLEFAERHVRWASDADHLPPSSPFAFSVSQHQGLFPLSRLFTSGGQSKSFSFSISPYSEYLGLVKW